MARVELTTSNPSACPGWELTLSHPSGRWPVVGRFAPEVRLREVTLASGEQERRKLDPTLVTIVDHETLRMAVPSWAVAGDIHIDFVGRIPNLNYQYRADFTGGRSSIDSLSGIAAYSNRCLLAGERLQLKWFANNMRELTLDWQFVHLDGRATEWLGSADVLQGDPPEVVVPSSTDPLVCIVTLRGTAACLAGWGDGNIRGGRQRRRAWLVEPEGPQLDLHMGQVQVERVVDYYHNRTEELTAYQTNDAGRLGPMIRNLEAIGHRIGVMSTGGSFEDITIPRANGWKQAMIDPWPALVGQKARSGDKDAYDDYIAAASKEASRQSQILRESIGERFIRSELSERAQRLYDRVLEAERGKPLSPVADRLVYIDATTKIFDLHKILLAQNKMLPTLGASGFQSIAGALATSTHGATLHLPPLANFVRAIHLIGPGGVHWWIDRGDIVGTQGRESLTRHLVERLDYSQYGGSEFRSQGRYENMPFELFKDSPAIRFLGNDYFDGALVHAGSLGYVHAVVLETVDIHHMWQSHFTQGDWSSIRAELAGVISKLHDEPGFISAADRPTFNWFEDDDEPTADEIPWFVQSTIASYGEGYLDMRSLGKPPPPDPFRDWSVRGGGWDIIEAAESHVEDAVKEALNKALDNEPDVAAARVARLMRWIWDETPGVLGVFDRVHEELTKTQLVPKEAGLAPGVLSGFGGYGFHRWEDTPIGYDTKRVAIEGVPSATEGHLRQVIRHLARSHEFAFPAPTALRFCDDMLTWAEQMRDHGDASDAVAFQLNLRFTRRSYAALAMQRWDLTGHVEIYSFPGISADGRLYPEIERLARLHRGAPHWGQAHTPGINYSEIYDVRQFGRVYEAISTPHSKLLDTFRHDYLVGRVL